MLLTTQPLLLLWTFATLSLSDLFLPEAPDAPIQEPGLEESFEYVVPTEYEGLRKREALPLPHSHHAASPPLPNLTPPQTPELVKRILEGRQRQCNSGYSLCRNSGRCCPNTAGSGRCCRDGTCVTNADTCCLGGEACPAGQDCCRNGCKPEGNTCCADNYNCDPGFKCCGNRTCAPLGGECCRGGGSCARGLRCVILNGVRGCCRNLACGSFDAGDDGGSATATNSASSISVPSITPLATNTLGDGGGGQIGSGVVIPSLSIPTLTYNAGAGSYRYYTTTLIFYYYSYFLTTRLATTSPTSTRTSTTTVVSVYASARVDANSIFRSVTSAISFPSSVTAEGFTDTTVTSGSTSSTGTSATATGTSGGGSGGGSGDGSGDGEAAGASKAAGRNAGVGAYLAVAVAVVVGLGSGIGMVIL